MGVANAVHLSYLSPTSYLRDLQGDYISIIINTIYIISERRPKTAN